MSSDHQVCKYYDTNLRRKCCTVTSRKFCSYHHRKIIRQRNHELMAKQRENHQQKINNDLMDKINRMKRTHKKRVGNLEKEMFMGVIWGITLTVINFLMIAYQVVHK